MGNKGGKTRPDKQSITSRINHEKKIAAIHSERDERLGDNSDQRRSGDEMTRYEPKHHPQAIAIRRLAKHYKNHRKIAKILGISVAEVDEVLATRDAS